MFREAPFALSLTGASTNGRTDEDANPTLRTWHFADLLFHARSRGGRHDEGFQVFKTTVSPAANLDRTVQYRLIPARPN